MFGFQLFLVSIPFFAVIITVILPLILSVLADGNAHSRISICEEIQTPPKMELMSQEISCMKNFNVFLFFSLDNSQSFQLPSPHLLVSFIAYPRKSL